MSDESDRNPIEIRSKSDQKSDPFLALEVPVLDALAQATTPQELLKAHQQARAAVKAQRRRFSQSWGVLAQTYAAAMQAWDDQKADGASFEERVRNLEQTLRAAWPKGREEPWHYGCERCNDTGFVIHVCRAGQRCDGRTTRTDSPSGTPGKYRRLCAQHPSSAYEHEYGVPCWCQKGARFTAAPKPVKGDHTQAGRSKAMSKVGRSVQRGEFTR